MKHIEIILMTLLLMLVSLPVYAAEGKIQLLWTNAEDAVMYELEVSRVYVDKDDYAPRDKVVYTTTAIYTPGVELDLSLFKDYNLRKLYYRVRPLDYEKKPVGHFSRPVALEKLKKNTIKPTTTVSYKNCPAPVYMVYAWIPVLNAAKYQIEITNHSPENPNGVTPSTYRVRTYTADKGFDYYDLEPYIESGNYYWRVMALNNENQPIGVYSDAVAFKVEKRSYKWGAFGDSITHGGGAISNPPSDPRFNYFTYLPVEVKNLGRSGDTAEMLDNRFEQDVLPFKPKYLIILGGSNSLRGGASAQEVIQSLADIKQKCLDNDIRPIFLTIPPLNPERIRQVFNQPTAENWQEELAAVNDFLKTQPDVIDIYSVLVDESGCLPIKYSQDGLHPDISGKRLMGKAIKDYIKEHQLK